MADPPAAGDRTDPSVGYGQEWTGQITPELIASMRAQMADSTGSTFVMSFEILAALLDDLDTARAEVAHCPVRPCNVESLARALDEARLDIALHAEAAHRFAAERDEARAERDQVRAHHAHVENAELRAELERLRQSHQEEAFLRIGAEAMVEEFREQRDSARGLAAALEAELAQIRALCEQDHLFPVTQVARILAVLDHATSEVCAEHGCSAAVHRQGWRCDAHVPPCGFRAHTAGCSCSRNECSRG